MTGKKILNAHLWERDQNDWYVEDEWVSSRLFEDELFLGTVLDPAAGMGNIVRSARANGLNAEGTDLVDRGYLASLRKLDFLKEPLPPGWQPDNIVCNPPFKHCNMDDETGVGPVFIERALQSARCKVAMLLPAMWLNGDTRARWIGTTPLYRIYYITPRPSMPPGAVRVAGQKPGGGRKDYVWVIWFKGFDGEVTARWLNREKQA